MKSMIALIFFAALFFVTPVMADPLIISTFQGHPFITIGNERVVREAYHRIGREIEIVKLPNSRALKWANSGRYDAELFRKKYGIEEAYPNLIKVPVYIHIEALTGFIKKPGVSIQGWGDLLSYKVSYALGFKAVKQSLIPGTDSVAVATMEQAFKKLNAGRTDVVIDLRSNGLLIIKKLGFNEIRMLEKPLEQLESYHYLHRKNKHLLDPLTKVLQEMQDEGVITKIHKQVEQELNAYLTP